MKTPVALKYAVLTLVFFTITKLSNAQDTLTYLIKANSNINLIVHSVDSADYVRMILPNSSSDRLITINEYYKNGKMKLIANGIKSTLNKTSGFVRYEGSCIDFYQSGKRKAISNYKEGKKVGEQYLYYPDGKIYTTLNYKKDNYYVANESFIIDSYDRNGEQICKNGNGRVIQYNSEFDEVVAGPVLNGLYEGKWWGKFSGPDTIKYALIYKEGVFKSGIGYDAAGKSYPFKYSHVSASPPKRIVDFIEKFRSNVKVSPQSGVTKTMLDSLKISFIVEKDGQLTNLETVKPVLPELMDALKGALEKCAKWKPTTFYGISQQSKITISLNVLYHIGVNAPEKLYVYSQTDLHNGVPIDFRSWWNSNIL
jgi:antitoxin component YwqK of YwqJK toxin-antitoxin module